MSGSIKDLIVKIMVDDDEIVKFQKAGGKSLEFGNAVNKGAMAGAAALGVLALGASTAGDAAADAQVSQQQLQFALDKFPATADTSSAALYRLNSQLALKTQYDDDAYASGQAVLAGFGLTGAQITKLTPLLGDYAAKTGKDIPTAAADLGKALNGQGKALKVLGINFKDTGDLSGNYGELVDGLTGKVGGYAESQGTTAVGANAIFKNSIGELWEALGQDLLPIMVQVSHAGLGLVNWMQENKGVVVGLAIGIGALSSAAIVASGVVKALAIAQAIQTATTEGGTLALLAQSVATKAVAVAQGVATGAQWLLNAALDANPIGIVVLAIAALVAGLIWFFTQTKLGQEIWANFTRFLGDAWENVVNFIGGLIDGIVGYFHNMQLGFQIIGSAISKWWNDLWSGIGKFFAGIWGGLQDIVKGAWNGILGFIESGVNGAIGLINGIIRGVNGVGGGIGIHLNLIPNVKLPRLAAGGITSGPMTAVIGDNPGGREAVIPLDSAAGRDLLSSNNGPTELGDRTIDKLADALARKVRTYDRQGHLA